MNQVLQEFRAKHGHFSWPQKIILTSLANSMTGDNLCETTMERLSHEVNMAKSTVSDLVRDMHTLGYLTKESTRGRHGRTRIRLQLPPAVLEDVLLQTAEFLNEKQMSEIRSLKDLTDSENVDKLGLPGNRKPLLYTIEPTTDNKLDSLDTRISILYNYFREIECIFEKIEQNEEAQQLAHTILSQIEKLNTDEFQKLQDIAQEYRLSFARISDEETDPQRSSLAAPTAPTNGNGSSRNGPDRRTCITEGCNARAARDGTIKHDRCVYCIIRETWIEHFGDRPPKPALHSKGNRRLANTRWKDPYFRENFEAAMARASKSIFLKTKFKGFNIKWFLTNDNNWEKCLIGNYDNDPNEVMPPELPTKKNEMNKFGGF